MDANLNTFSLLGIIYNYFVALICILQYIKVLSSIIKIIEILLAKVNGIKRLESFNVLSSLVLAHSKNFIAYKSILSRMFKRCMYTMTATIISIVSMAIIDTYIEILDPKFVFRFDSDLLICLVHLFYYS